MRLVVSIDELVLRGVSPGERHRIGDALETELAARLARPGAGKRLAAGGDREALLASFVGDACCDDASELAAGIARALGVEPAAGSGTRGEPDRSGREGGR